MGAEEYDIMRRPLYTAQFTPTIYGKADNGAFCDGPDLRRTAEEDRARNAFAADEISQGRDRTRLKSICPEHGFGKGWVYDVYSYLVDARPDLERKRGERQRLSASY